MALSLDRQNRYREQYRRLRPGWQPATEVYEASLRQHLRPNARVLDLGCGRGGVLEQLGDAVAQPLGFDPDPASLVEHRLPRLPRAQALADRLPLRDASIDLIACSWVFEHLPQPERVFSEMRRVLKPTGKAVFLTPHSHSLVVLLNRVLRPVQHRLVERLYGRAEVDTFPILYRANTRAQIMRLAAESGLHCETLRSIDDPTYLAFHPLLFRLSVGLSRFTPPVHWVGVLRPAFGSA
jgi:SAM-dependent methyltransferase